MSEGRGTVRRFYRSRHDRMIAGVAGGLGDYFGVDPVLVRLAFVVLTLTSGIGFLAYLVLAIITPERPAGEEEPVVSSVARNRRGAEAAGYLLVAFGLLFLAANLGLFRFAEVARFWPLLLIGGGVLLLLKRARTSA